MANSKEPHRYAPETKRLENRAVFAGAKSQCIRQNCCRGASHSKWPHNTASADGQVIVIGRVGAQCGNVHFVNGKVWVTDNAISFVAQRKVEPGFYAFFLRS